MTKIRYYDLERRWKKIEPHIADPVVQKVLVRDFHKFTFGRWNRALKPGNYPREFESCDWDNDWCEKNGWDAPQPEYWKYVKHAACHWLVNFCLRLAEKVEPQRPWRILTSPGHSTVFDGTATLFDFNFKAFGIPARETYETAREGGRELRVGKERRVYLAEHYTKE